MMLIWITLIFVLMAFGLYRIAQAAFLPSVKAVDAVKNIHRKKNMTERLQNALLPLAKLLSRLFPMSEYRQRRLEADFSRLNIRQTPQQYVGAVLAKALLLALIGLLFIPLGIPWLSLLTAVAAVLAYFKGIQTIRKKVEVLNREVEAELPRMVETLNYSLQDNRDLLSFFEQYRKVSSKALGAELDRLIVDMKTGNQEAALRNMDVLCRALCDTLRRVSRRRSADQPAGAGTGYTHEGA
jgi:Flp pilus assembly protein TadB